jgi:hypothetical protein
LQLSASSPTLTYSLPSGPKRSEPPLWIAAWLGSASSTTRRDATSSVRLGLVGAVRGPSSVKRSRCIDALSVLVYQT